MKYVEIVVYIACPTYAHTSDINASPSVPRTTTPVLAVEAEFALERLNMVAVFSQYACLCVVVS